jgi:hypothetical protein
VRQSERVEAVVFRTDSLTATETLQRWHNRKVDIRHIEWSAPDSMERQYVRSVTLVTASEEATTETVAKAVAVREEEVYGVAEREAESRTPAAGWRWWIWVGGAVVLALAVKFFSG